MTINYTAGNKVPYLNREFIREFAWLIRQTAGISGPYFPVVEFVERLAAEEVFELKICQPEEMRDPANLGEYRPQTNTIQFPEKVYDSAADGNGSARLTVAHEFGHFLLHKESFALAQTREFIPHVENEDSEWQCDCFGGELLFSYRHLALVGSPVEASVLFGISIKAAKYQWKVFQEEGLFR